MKELDTHHHDYATKYLASHSTYILVEKQMVANENDGHQTPEVTYLPLLDNTLLDENFPNYNLHVHTLEKKTPRKGRHKSQSPSPAGVKSVRGPKGRAGQPRVPSRKR